MQQAFSPERVLEAYGVPYTRAGKALRARCPFHDEENASFYLRPPFSWYCYGCGKGGDLAEFLALIDDRNRCALAGKNDLQVLQECGRILKRLKAGALFGYARPAQDVGEAADAGECRSRAWQYYAGLPATDWSAQDVGEAAGVRDYLLGRGFEPWLLARAGCKHNPSGAYGALFPICEDRDFRGWVARTVDPGREPKYLYNRGFIKKDCLAGVFGAGDAAIVVEGMLDKLKANQAGLVKNVFALLGWSLSDRQAAKLRRRGIKCVICALDADRAGEQGFERLKQFFPSFRFRYPPGVKDLGELRCDELRRICKLNLDLFNEWKGNRNGYFR